MCVWCLCIPYVLCLHRDWLEKGFIYNYEKSFELCVCLWPSLVISKPCSLYAARHLCLLSRLVSIPCVHRCTAAGLQNVYICVIGSRIVPCLGEVWMYKSIHAYLLLSKYPPSLSLFPLWGTEDAEIKPGHLLRTQSWQMFSGLLKQCSRLGQI